jgi:hypothetical protein
MRQAACEPIRSLFFCPHCDSVIEVRGMNPRGLVCDCGAELERCDPDLVDLPRREA